MKTFYLKRGAPMQQPASKGFVLLDAMVAVLIFSFGVLGMVALQSSAIQLTSNANYRMNAAMLADQVIAQMWTDPTNLAGYATGGAQYTTWANTLNCSSATKSTSCLPGVTATPPSITIGPATTYNGVNPNYLVTVTINWQAPNDTTAHSYVSITQIQVGP
jgi:type IV pilus assembly protein PilV